MKLYYMPIKNSIEPQKEAASVDLAIEFEGFLLLLLLLLLV